MLLIIVVHIKICMNLIHDLDYLFSKNPVILINITWNLLKIVAAPTLSFSTLNVYVNTS